MKPLRSVSCRYKNAHLFRVRANTVLYRTAGKPEYTAASPQKTDLIRHWQVYRLNHPAYSDAFPESPPVAHRPFVDITVAETQCRILTGFRTLPCPCMKFYPYANISGSACQPKGYEQFRKIFLYMIDGPVLYFFLQTTCSIGQVVKTQPSHG